MQQWEYAELLSIRRYLIIADEVTERHETRFTFTHGEHEGGEGGDFWAALRKLGEDGWEMVSLTREDTRDALTRGAWFKRPLAT